jgi:3-methyladenine DNA glycosylase AlkD
VTLPPAQRFSDAVITRLLGEYGAAADPARADAMAAYMRHRFPFLGIPTPQRRALSRKVLASLSTPDEAELLAVAEACWSLEQREYQYFGTDLLVRHAARLTPGSLTVLERLITTKSWWDTVDTLASRVVGPVVARHPGRVATTDAWIVTSDVWLIRTALLHQLRYGAATDSERLFRYCLTQAGHRDFFVRKAIGWALREYTRTDSEAVRRFVEEHRGRLSALSVREALRHFPPTS